MQIEKIITVYENMSSLSVVLRSLRSHGCELPIFVIPKLRTLEQQLSLPDGCHWWHGADSFEEPLQELRGLKENWLLELLTQQNYFFCGSKACFLSNPETVLSAHSGFVVADLSLFDWRLSSVHNSSLQFLRTNFIDWRFRIFSAGQFASELACPASQFLETLNHPALRAAISEPLAEHYLQILFLALIGWKPNNLCLPPSGLASGNASDYELQPAEWTASQLPICISWSERIPDGSHPTDAMFLMYLSRSERQTWEQELAQTKTNAKRLQVLFSEVEQRLLLGSKILKSGHDHLICANLLNKVGRRYW